MRVVRVPYFYTGNFEAQTPLKNANFGTKPERCDVARRGLPDSTTFERIPIKNHDFYGGRNFLLATNLLIILTFAVGRWHESWSSDVGRRYPRYGRVHRVHLRLEAGHHSGTIRPSDNRRSVPATDRSQKTPTERRQIHGRSRKGTMIVFYDIYIHSC